MIILTKRKQKKRIKGTSIFKSLTIYMIIFTLSKKNGKQILVSKNINKPKCNNIKKMVFYSSFRSSCKSCL